MKNLMLIFLLLISAVACSEKQPAVSAEETYVELNYDTTAIDSFSEGAISVDVANEIRRSSKAYQDSLKAVAEALEKERLEQELKAKEDKAKADEAKKEQEKERKAAETKKAAEKQAAAADSKTE